MAGRKGSSREKGRKRREAQVAGKVMEREVTLNMRRTRKSGKMRREGKM